MDSQNNINNDSNNDISQYNKYNFTYLKGNTKDFSFKFTKYSLETIYIISKNHFDEGIKLIQDKDQKNIKNNLVNFNNRIKFYFELKEFENIYKKEEYSIVTESFLQELEINEEEYKDKYIYFFEIDSKKYLLFKNNDLLEISETQDNIEKKDNDLTIEENSLEQKKKLILLFAIEKEIFKLIKSPIQDEYDINEYYLISKTFIDS